MKRSGFRQLTLEEVKAKQAAKREKAALTGLENPLHSKFKKKPLKPMNKLRKEADDWHSRYIRLRDSRFDGQQWTGTCITCSRTGVVAYLDPETRQKRPSKAVRYVLGWDNGHFISRGVLVTRFNEQNVNLQCSYRCNRLRSGEYEKYRLALKEKYGDEVPEELEELARTTTYYKFTRPELEQIIADAKEYVLGYDTKDSAR